MAESIDIDTDAFFFHVDKDVDKRKFYVAIEFFELLVFKASDHEGIELPEGSGLCNTTFGFEPQDGGTDKVEGVTHFGIDEVMGELDVEDFPTESDVEFSEDVFEIFEVETEFDG